MKKGITVLEAKRFGIISCSSKTSTGRVCARMVEEDISSMVIVNEDGYLEGIVSRTDLLKAYMQNDHWTELPIGMMMTRQVVTVGTRATLMDVAKILTEKHIHRVVVVREEGEGLRPVAVVSDSDLVYHMSKELD